MSRFLVQGAERFTAFDIGRGRDWTALYLRDWMFHSGPDYSPGAPVSVAIDRELVALSCSSTAATDHLAAKLADICDFDTALEGATGGFVVHGRRKDYHPWQLAGLREVQ